MVAPGQQIGRYRVSRKLGSGGYADVWLAVEEGNFGFQKEVALKVLRDLGEDPHAIRELLNEARVCGLLQHANVIHVHAVEQFGSELVVAMEYVDGVSLSELLKTMRRATLRLPRVIVLDLAIEIARGLEYAHRATGPDGPLNVVHRDLKPPNVLFSKGGAVKIADFGLASATTNQDKTATGLLKGTPRYLAPEVWSDQRDYGPWTDWFSFGALLWELVMGEAMWPAEVPKAAARSLFGTVETDLERLDDRIPELRPLIASLLERDPQVRRQVAGTVVDELRRIRRGLDGGGALEPFARLVVGGVPLAAGLGAEPDWAPLAQASGVFPVRRRADTSPGSRGGSGSGGGPASAVPASSGSGSAGPGSLEASVGDGWEATGDRQDAPPPSLGSWAPAGPSAPDVLSGPTRSVRLPVDEVQAPLLSEDRLPAVGEFESPWTPLAMRRRTSRTSWTSWTSWTTTRRVGCAGLRSRSPWRLRAWAWCSGP